jgi:recombination protein RecA
MSYALRRLTSIISKTNCCVIFINQLRALISTGYGSGPTETTTGGRALKFYSSVRLEVKRGKKIDKGDETIGHELYMKVVKNKQAPPFRTAHASLIYGKGVPKGVAVVDMALDYEVIKRKGSWLAYKGETLGQGKESVAQLIEKNPDLEREIVAEVMAAVGKGLGYVLPPAESEGDKLENEPIGKLDVEEGILDLSEDEK